MDGWNKGIDQIDRWLVGWIVGWLVDDMDGWIIGCMQEAIGRISEWNGWIHDGRMREKQLERHKYIEMWPEAVMHIPTTQSEMNDHAMERQDST